MGLGNLPDLTRQAGDLFSYITVLLSQVYQMSEMYWRTTDYEIHLRKQT